jgi:hypothetical protein
MKNQKETILHISLLFDQYKEATFSGKLYNYFVPHLIPDMEYNLEVQFCKNYFSKSLLKNQSSYTSTILITQEDIDQKDFTEFIILTSCINFDLNNYNLKNPFNVKG